MSGEFGEDGCGFFHDKVRRAAEDCEGNPHELTRLYGDLLRTMEPVARGISWYQACDSGPDRPLIDLIEALPEMERAFKALRDHAEPYRSVAEDAVRKAVEDGATIRPMSDDPVRNVLRNGLKAICSAGDGVPFTDEYRRAGGGYEGLQAIAEKALAVADKFEREGRAGP